jgi:K+-transporting ATPase A subunit
MNSIKSLIYTTIGILIFIAVAKFFISLLPYLILVGLVLYLLSKLSKFINGKGNNSKRNTYKAYETNDNIKTYTGEVDDSYIGKVVDVDFEEVNK